jgi:large conductance mechanosensitive channel
MRGFLSEFKAFAMRGNVMDMAVGVIIGGAFGKIVSALVDNIFMPVLGLIVGGMDFKDLAVTMKEAQEAAPAVTLKYGAFIQAVFDFTIVAFCIFLTIKALNAFKKKEAAAPVAPPVPPEDIRLLTEIRDLLKK